MAAINFRLAELRKRKGMTQQELADVIGVSFQTISKWENGTSLPNITILPVISEYFNVSADQLIGIRPLDEERYIPETTGTSAFWEKKLEYLLRTRRSYWNDDYMDFLIHKVWKVDKPIHVLDCGCGFGFLGLLLMPLLPKASTYTGIDFAGNLLEQGKKLFSKQNIRADFINKNVFDYHVKERYDFVICQAVLRHLDSPEAFIKKMTDFGKEDSWIVCIDANREFECDGLYIDGMDYAKLCRHDGLEKHWKTELEMQGRDYAAAIRSAHIMRKLGLKHVDVRMNDKVEFVTPDIPDYEQIKQDFICYNDWNAQINDSEKEKRIQYFLSHGMDRKEAEEYCNRSTEIANYFKSHPDAGYTFVKGQMISYGKKKNAAD